MNLNYTKKDGLFLKLLEALGNIFLVILGYYLAYYLRFNFQPSLRNLIPLYNILPYIALATLLVFAFLNMFSMLGKAKGDVFINIIFSLMMINVITAGILFFSRGFAFPRSIFFVAFFVQLLLITPYKFFVLWLLKRTHKKKDILILGSREDAANIARKLLLEDLNLDNLKYICNNTDNSIYPLIEKVDKIYVGSTVDNKVKSDIISYCMGRDKKVYLVPEFFEIAMINAKTIQLDDIPVFEIDNFQLSMESMIIKRLFDILISTICIIITLPLMAVIAATIKLSDRGPVLYIQERITRGNRSFSLYKFRTMVVDAEKRTGPVLASDKDPRITPLGRLLRSARLDELPQLFNVFKGEMSIVGPRPERPYFINKFARQIPNFKYRVVVKAGITGLAQVLGKYTTDPEDKVRFDLLYIRNYSFLLDIKIIFKTLRVMFKKDSSNGITKDKSLEEIFSRMNIKTSEETEARATRIDLSLQK